MNYSFARTFRRPTSQGVGAVRSSDTLDAFSDRIWRGVGAGEEDEQPNLPTAFAWGAGVGTLLAIGFSFTKWGVVGHLQRTYDGMKGAFGVSK